MVAHWNKVARTGSDLTGRRQEVKEVEEDDEEEEEEEGRGVEGGSEVYNNGNCRGKLHSELQR